VKIRIEGGFGHAADRIFVINDRLVEAIEAARAGGYELKPSKTTSPGTMAEH
jgi:hypothetical protein